MGRAIIPDRGSYLRGYQEGLKMAKKRNPQDTTLRNTRAANRKIKILTERVDQLATRVNELEGQLERHEEVINSIGSAKV